MYTSGKIKLKLKGKEGKTKRTRRHICDCNKFPPGGEKQEQEEGKTN